MRGRKAEEAIIMLIWENKIQRQKMLRRRRLLIMHRRMESLSILV